MSFLEEVGETWLGATRYLHVIKSLMAKYSIASNFSSYQTSKNEENADSETSPKDYRFDERSEQRVAGSLPTMPQLLPHSSLLTAQ